jgi:radical SAM protein with 4Fe4S-binding SPASM domain
VLMTLNLHEYHQMKKMAEDYNAEFRFDANINSALDGSHDPLRYRVSPEEVVQLDADDPGRCSVLAEKYRDLRPMNPNDNVFLCGAGKNLFHIDSFGKLHMCTMARVPAYDLRQGSFRDGWRNFLQEARLRKLTRPSVCRSCEYRLACTVCAGWSQTEFGDAEEHPVEYLCQITRLRAGMFAGENTAVNTLAKGE